MADIKKEVEQVTDQAAKKRVQKVNQAELDAFLHDLNYRPKNSPIINPNLPHVPLFLDEQEMANTVVAQPILQRHKAPEIAPTFDSDMPPLIMPSLKDPATSGSFAKSKHILFAAKTTIDNGSLTASNKSKPDDTPTPNKRPK